MSGEYLSREDPEYKLELLPLGTSNRTVQTGFRAQVLPSNAEVKNEWSCNSVTPIYLHGVKR
jgi:hypothetical protein